MGKTHERPIDWANVTFSFTIRMKAQVSDPREIADPHDKLAQSLAAIAEVAGNRWGAPLLGSREGEARHEAIRRAKDAEDAGT